MVILILVMLLKNYVMVKDYLHLQIKKHPNGDGSGKPVGTCFIAAGTRNGIHTYGFEFSGIREEITEKGVNAALFYAVKTIKNN